jgi:hypothetical protein
MARLAVLLLVVAALAALPAAGTAASIPVEVSKQQEAPPRPATENGVSDSQLALMALGAVVLIAGIWVVIVRDARRRVPEHKRRAAARASDAPGARRARARGRKLSPAERRRRKRSRAG